MNLLNPQDILQKVEQRYLQCRSYIDSGSVQFADVKEQPQTIAFRTHLIRPDYLCFEWQDYGPVRGKSEEYSMLWSKGSDNCVKFPWGLERFNNIETAVPSVTGCSVGAAILIPALLLEQLRVNCRHLLQLVNLRLLKDENVGEHCCHVLTGGFAANDNYTLWVEQDAYIVHRIYSERSWSAQESEAAHRQLMANTQVLNRLAESGIKPPPAPQHKDGRLATTYDYMDIRFDETREELSCPMNE